MFPLLTRHSSRATERAADLPLLLLDGRTIPLTLQGSRTPLEVCAAEIRHDGTVLLLTSTGARVIADARTRLTRAVAPEPQPVEQPSRVPVTTAAPRAALRRTA